jgi:hypothetical protein
MKISVKSVQTMAADAGLPESIVDRHLEALCEMILRARTQERKTCINNIRGWFHKPSSRKPPLHDLLEALEQTTN